MTKHIDVCTKLEWPEAYDLLKKISNYSRVRFCRYDGKLNTDRPDAHIPYRTTQGLAYLMAESRGLNYYKRKPDCEELTNDEFVDYCKARWRKVGA